MNATTMESPSFYERPKHATPSTFVIFSVDPVSSVSALRDAEATHQAGLLPQTKHLGIIQAVRNESVTWDALPMKPPMSLALMVVGRGLPIINPDACTPLFSPNLHPTARPPVKPDHPLPWPDCYVYSGNNFSARVDRIHLCDADCVNRVSEMDVDQLDENDMQDLLRLRPVGPPSDSDSSSHHGDSSDTDLQRSASASVEQSVRARSLRDLATQGQDGPADPLYQLLTPRVSGADDEKADDASVTPSSHSSQSEAVVGREPQAVRPRIEVWFDLTAVTDIAHPDELARILDRLDEIEKDVLTRAAEIVSNSKPDPGQWAQEVANARDAEAPDAGAATTDVALPTAPESGTEPPPTSTSAKKSRTSLATATARRFVADILQATKRLLARLVASNPLRRRPPTGGGGTDHGSAHGQP